MKRFRSSHQLSTCSSSPIYTQLEQLDFHAPNCPATTPRRCGPRVRPIPRTGRLAAASSLSARTPPPQCRPCLREAYLAPGSHPHESRQPTHELSSCPGFPYIEKLGQLESWHPVHPKSVHPKSARSRVTAPGSPGPTIDQHAKTPGFSVYGKTWRLDAVPEPPRAYPTPDPPAHRRRRGGLEHARARTFARTQVRVQWPPDLAASHLLTVTNWPQWPPGDTPRPATNCACNGLPLALPPPSSSVRDDLRRLQTTSPAHQCRNVVPRGLLLASPRHTP